MAIINFCVGFVIGSLIVLIFYASKYSGFLRIDVSDSEKDVYLIDINKDLNTLPKKKIIVLKIDNKYRKTH